MKSITLKLTAFFIAASLLFTSCTEKEVLDNTGNPGPENQANTVNGVVLDTKGQPIANAKVRAENTALTTDAFVEGKTDANGHYSLPLSPIGGWTIYAWKDVTDADGQLYHLRIAGATDADYEPFAPGKNTVYATLNGS